MVWNISPQNLQCHNIVKLQFKLNSPVQVGPGVDFVFPPSQQQEQQEEEQEPPPKSQLLVI